MSEVQADYDGAWKELVERHAPEVLALLFPLVHGDIDWKKDWSLNEQEVRSLRAQVLPADASVDDDSTHGLISG